MAYYSIKVGLNSDITQQELIDMLRNSGADVIQISDGIAVKTDKPISDLKQEYDKLSALHFESLNPQEIQANQETPENLKSFVLNQ